MVLEILGAGSDTKAVNRLDRNENIKRKKKSTVSPTMKKKNYKKHKKKIPIPSERNHLVNKTLI